MCSTLVKLIVIHSLWNSVNSQDNDRPNIVTIIADDLGWNDVGFHGSNQIPTPNIDALAYNGIILNRHYTMPTCTPSRTAYLTGKYPIRTGMQGYPLKAGEPRGLPLEEVTLPDRLRQLGYTTRLVGKWHQGYHETDYTPTRRGFDSFFGYWNGYIGYFNNKLIEKNKTGYDFRRDLCSTKKYEGLYATDVFTQEAVDLITSHDKRRPLYLQLSHLAVHTGNAEDPLEVPDVVEAHRKFKYIVTPERRLYAEMLTQLDKSVGQVVQSLADNNMLNNTIIIFIADNGAQTQGLHANWGSNWPLRGLKFTLHEGGVRGVAAIWSPSFQEPPRVSNQLFHLSDWLPTLYSAAGGKVSDLGPLDGIDQWESLIDSNIVNPRTQILLNIDQNQKMEALIDNSWKITLGDYDAGVYDGYFGDDGRGPENPVYDVTQVLESRVNRVLERSSTRLSENEIERLRSEASISCVSERDKRSVSISRSLIGAYSLYNLQSDPCEMNNLAFTHQDIVARLGQVIDSFHVHVVSEINLPVDPQSDPALYNDTWISWLDEPGSNLEQCKNKAFSVSICVTWVNVLMSLLTSYF